MTHDKVTVCPVCQRKNDAATNLKATNSAPPAPGDLTICYGCGAELIFADDGSARELTEADRERIHPDDLRLLARAAASRRDARSIDALVDQYRETRATCACAACRLIRVLMADPSVRSLIALKREPRPRPRRPV